LPGIDPPFRAEPLTQFGASSQHPANLGGKSRHIFLGDQRALLRRQNVASAHDGRGHHRHPQTHRLQQHQSLGLGARSEHKSIARLIATAQFEPSRQIAHKAQIGGQPQFGSQPAQRRLRWTLAGDDQHRSGWVVLLEFP
jgi:hypothetical protein